MQYFKINDNLYLVEQEVVKSAKSKPAPKNLNHIFIMDRSGSMYGVIRQLAEDLKARLRSVPVGDTVTLGWFSSEGDWNWMIKGFKVTDQKDFTTLDKVIDQNNYTLGMTCFSQILGDIDTVVKDLSALGNNFSLSFFSDGYPVVSNYTKEIEAIRSAIAKVSGKISSSLLIGYGNYYNKELMADMAERFGGSLIHQSDIKTFPVVLGSFMERARDNGDKILVELGAKPHDGGVVFSISGDGVNVYAVDSGRIAFAPTKAKTDYVYVITDKAPHGSDDVTQDVIKQKNEHMLKATYAAAYVMTQRTKTDVALDILATVGDKSLVNRITNAFTNDEYGSVEQGILGAIGSPNKRFTEGQHVGCLPKPDAFCVLDALDILMNDPEAEFYPYHDEFTYNRIGVAAKVKDGYPKFQAKKDARVPLTGLVWNDSKLNLSVRAKIDGTINLEGADKVGLPKVYDTYVWRNYTIIKDGFLNVQKLPVTLSKANYDMFLTQGVIDKEHNRHYKGHVYLLHLDRLPVINRNIARQNTSARGLCLAALRETELMAHLKALNHVRNELEPKEGQSLGLSLTPEQEQFLKERGVTKSGFNPPTEKEDPTDFYMAKEFEIKIKGLSSLPKVEEVKAKVLGKKTLTASARLVADGLEETAKVGKNLTLIDNLIQTKKAELNVVRSSIQRAKFACLLAKQSFDEFTSRDNMNLSIADNDYEFSIREVKVAI